MAENQPSLQPPPTQEPAPVRIVQQPLKVLFSWKSAARPFKPRNREVFTTLFSIIFLVCVILVFIKEWLLIMVLISIAFLFYVQNTVKPEDVEHKITTRGVVTANKQYPWEMLGRFWYEKKFQKTVLMIEHYGGFPSRIMIVIANKEKHNVTKILEQYLLKEKPEKTQIEKAGEWLQKKVPLESSPSNPSSQPSSSTEK